MITVITKSTMLQKLTFSNRSIIFQIDPSLTNHQTVCMLTSVVQAANWWTLCDQCGLSVIRSVILSVSRITAKVISRFHWNMVPPRPWKSLKVLKFKTLSSSRPLESLKMIMVLSFQPISLKLGRPGKLLMVIRSWVQIPDHIPLPSPLRYLEF